MHDVFEPIVSQDSLFLLPVRTEIKVTYDNRVVLELVLLSSLEKCECCLHLLFSKCGRLTKRFVVGGAHDEVDRDEWFRTE